MNGKPQSAQPLQVVNLSEGCTPPPGREIHGGLCNLLKMNGKLQRDEPLQVVNLSEGWTPAGKLQRTQPLQVVNLSEGCYNEGADEGVGEEEVVGWDLDVGGCLVKVALFQEGV